MADEKTNYDPTSVSLKEFLLDKIKDLNDKMGLYVEHLQSQLNIRTNSLEDRIEEKTKNIESSAAFVAKNLETRLNGMNEFREQLRDQTINFVRREEVNLMKTNMESEIKVLNRSKDILEGKATMMSVYIAYGLSLIGIILSILKFFVK